MDTEFGISEAESAASGFRSYNPGAGLKSSSLELYFERYFSRNFSIFLGSEVEYYFSRASDSPLIDEAGTDLTIGASLGLRYSI